MGTEKNMIIIRVYYAIRLRLLSPLSISNGEAYITDSDVLIDGSGNPFIPGTSIAGALRNYLNLDKDKDCLMGYSNGEDGRMSPLIIHDVYLEESKRNIRDGVKLNEDKTVMRSGKFDMEIVETGASGWLFMELNHRSGTDLQQYEEQIEKILYHLHSGEIRLGANKNRGFGRVEIIEIYRKHFDKTKVDEWLQFMEDTRCIDRYRKGNEKQTFEGWMKDKNISSEGRYIKISVPLKLDGGISIRKYSAEPGKADYEHITCNESPVIPGSSWNGAIRSRMLRLLKDIPIKDAEHLMDEWFGYVSVSDKKKEGNNNKQPSKYKAQQSKVVIGESVIDGAEKLPMTRTKINRFDASASGQGLYQELSYFGGTTKLEIMIDKSAGYYMALIALFVFVIEDIQKGYLPVGGQTAVGRGLFKGNGDIEYSESGIDIAACRQALFQLAKG